MPCVSRGLFFSEQTNMKKNNETFQKMFKCAFLCTGYHQYNFIYNKFRYGDYIV